MAEVDRALERYRKRKIEHERLCKEFKKLNLRDALVDETAPKSTPKQ